jgi:UDP-N-acetylenolpyruvoylglucosamine reductase
VDVLTLAQVAHDAVQEQFGIDLQREIIVLGRTAPGDGGG